MEIIFLCFFSFLAGFIDAIVGGGGLVQVPAFFVTYPKMLPALLLGTNKLISAAGTAAATYRYACKVSIPWNIVSPAMIMAFFFSMFGTQVVTWLDPSIFRPLIIILLIFVAIYIFISPNLGTESQPKFTPKIRMFVGVLSGAIIGFYDGFFGPGTGIFLMFLFIRIFGCDFLTASASAKAINLATNIAALICFGYQGNIWYKIAMPLLFCNILGAIVGTRLAIDKGNRFIRAIFILVVVGMIAKLCYDSLFS